MRLDKNNWAHHSDVLMPLTACAPRFFNCTGTWFPRPSEIYSSYTQHDGDVTSS